MKLTSSRICVISSHPARRKAGVMNLVQTSRSLRLFLSMRVRLLPFAVKSMGGYTSSVFHYPIKRPAVVDINVEAPTSPSGQRWQRLRLSVTGHPLAKKASKS